MKSSILIVTGSLMLALAFARQNPTPEPKPQNKSDVQSQSKAKTQVEGINNLSDILEERLVLIMANRVGAPLDRTRQALKDEEGLCELHHETLHKTTVPILYGLRPGPLYSNETEKRLFPNGITDIDAGCFIEPVKVAIVLQCHYCLEAKRNWLNSPR